MRTKCLTLGLSVAASAMAMAADLVIGVGESQTISGVQSYDRIFCNGSLTIEEGAEISCTSFCMVGKYKGWDVAEILTKDPGYYTWILGSEFTNNTKQVLTRIRLREFNKRMGK